MRAKDFMQLVGWEVINPAILRLKKKKRYIFDTSYRGINLGCGLSNPPNWLGIDGGIYLLFRYAPDFVMRLLWSSFNLAGVYSLESYTARLRSINVMHYDLASGIPFDESTIPAIYSSHFLEHLFQEDAATLIRECYRVMRPGGIVRIGVPSLREECARIKDAITAYENGDSEKIQLFVTSQLTGFVNEFSRHRFMYDYPELRNILMQSGFVAVTEKSFGVGDIPEVGSLDTKEGLFVEATKPPSAK